MSRSRAKQRAAYKASGSLKEPLPVYAQVAISKAIRSGQGECLGHQSRKATMWRVSFLGQELVVLYSKRTHSVTSVIQGNLMESKPRIIAILGEAGSGKDTAAEHAIASLEYMGAKAKSIAFADPMKEFAEKVFGFSYEQLWGPSEFRNAVDPRFDSQLFREACRQRFTNCSWPWVREILPTNVPFEKGLSALHGWFQVIMGEATITPRLVLQTLGTEFGRSLDDSIWIKKGLKSAKAIADSGYWCFIRDVRFKNEARILREQDVELWRMTRPGLDSSMVQKAGVAGHASEAEQRSPEMNAYVSFDIINDGTLDDLKKKVDARIVGTRNPIAIFSPWRGNATWETRRKAPRTGV